MLSRLSHVNEIKESQKSWDFPVLFNFVPFFLSLFSSEKRGHLANTNLCRDIEKRVIRTDRDGLKLEPLRGGGEKGQISEREEGGQINLFLVFGFPGFKG